MGDKDKYLVDGLAHEMEELKLPPPVTRSLHETLGIIRDINGSAVPEEVRHKQLLTLRVTDTLNLFRFLREMQAAHVAGCQISRRVRVDESTGHTIMPWEDDIAKAVSDGFKTQKMALAEEAAAASAADDSGLEVNIPGMPKFIKVHGKAATKAIGIAVVICYMGYSIYRDHQFEKRVETRLTDVSQDQAYNRSNATAQRTKIREDVQDLVDKGDRDLQYEPAVTN